MIDIFKIVKSIKGNNFIEYHENFQESYLNATDEDGINLLQAAIAYKQDDIALDLISKGIDVNHQDPRGQAALHFAAAHNKIEIARAILKNGGNINIRDNFGNNALWTATMNARGNYKLVELYLQFNGNPNNKNSNNKSPLDFAIQINDEHLISLLKS